MITFRDQTAARLGLDLLVHVNEEGRPRDIAVSSGSAIHTQVMKTEALRHALDKWHFDAAIGGARRDEERAGQRNGYFPTARPIIIGSRQPAPGALAAV